MNLYIHEKTKEILQEKIQYIKKEFKNEDSIFLNNLGDKEYMNYVDECIVELNMKLPKECKSHKILCDLQITYLETELHTLYVNLLKEENAQNIQLQYSDWDCGLACLQMLSNNTIIAIDEFLKHSCNSKRGLSLTAIKNILKSNAIEFKERKIKMELNVCDFTKGIYVVTEKLGEYGHFIYSDGIYIYDSEAGIFEINEYKENTQYKMVLASLNV